MSDPTRIPEEELCVRADEQTLVARIRTGDAAAFQQLFQRYAAPLADFIFRYVRVQEDAEEAVQEVFLKIWRGREQLRVLGSLNSYMYLAARNQALDRLKTERLALRRHEHFRLERASLAVTLDDNLQMQELDAAIERALAAQPERRRVVCKLRWIEHLSYAEIAQQLGISEKTVENQIGRALQDIRKRLDAFLS